MASFSCYVSCNAIQDVGGDHEIKELVVRVYKGQNYPKSQLHKEC
jgi:hypothetical protein